METIWKSAIEVSGKRWLFVAFTPAVFLCALLTFLLLDVTDGVLSYWHQWLILSIQDQMLLLILFFIISVFISFVLDMLGNTVLRMLTGQVGFIGLVSWFYKWRKRHYEKLIKNYQVQFSDLQQKDNEQKLGDFQRMQKQRLDDMLMYYPLDANKAMPTLLGNIIRSAQEKINARYGLDTRATWLYLYPSIGEVLRSAIDNSRDLLDFSVRLIVAWSIFILACLPFSAYPIGWEKSMILIGFSFLMIFVFYRLANNSAMNYSDLLNTAYALHRFDLYKKLNFELPECSGECEKMYGEILSEFLWRGRDDIKFVFRDEAETGGNDD